jgi:hypothetical protein
MTALIEKHISDQDQWGRISTSEISDDLFYLSSDSWF